MDLQAFFKNEGIPLYTALPFEVCKIINPRLLERTLPDARSVLLFILPYYTGRDEGNLSLYARSKDYHLYAKELWGKLSALLSEAFPEHHFCSFVDHSPINEVHACGLGGLGVIGDNGLLITKDYGSFIFLGEVLSDLEYTAFGLPEPALHIEGCLHCGKCRQACPCHFEDCASGISQKKGTLTPEEQELFFKTDLIWGCDHCQLVCPLNKNAQKTAIPFFYEERINTLTAEGLDAMSKEEFEKRAFAWRGRAVPQRNLALWAERAERNAPTINPEKETTS